MNTATADLVLGSLAVAVAITGSVAADDDAEVRPPILSTASVATVTVIATAVLAVTRLPTARRNCGPLSSPEKGTQSRPIHRLAVDGGPGRPLGVDNLRSEIPTSS